MAKDKGPPKEKHAGGRPAAYTNAKEMQTIVDKYFEDCKGKPLLDDEGRPYLDKNYQPIIIDKMPPSVAGLALALGFNSRQSLLNYQDKPEFMDILKRAKLKIEIYNNSRLYDKDGVQGAKFNLSVNYGYVEKQSIEHSGQIGVKIVDDIE